MKLTIALVCSCLFYQAYSQTEASSPQCQGSILELVATSIQSLQSQLDENKLEIREIKRENDELRQQGSTAFTATVLTTTAAVNVLKYSNPLVNLGNALSPDTGEFTAPVNGTYWFSFTGKTFKLSEFTKVTIRVNGVPKLESGTNTPQNSFTLATGGVFTLGAGDVVDIQVNAGRIHEGLYSHFSGFIIQKA